MANILGQIKWLSKKVEIGERVFLFCFRQKCMSGRIIELKATNKYNEFEILVDFIEPEYFQDDFITGNDFTINEASNVLGIGKVKEVM